MGNIIVCIFIAFGVWNLFFRAGDDISQVRIEEAENSSTVM